MIIYSQRDPKWVGLNIGESTFKMGPFGCLTTCLAQAFLLAGYPDITPGVLCTTKSFYDTQGDLKWFNETAVYPQYKIHYRSDVGRYVFVQVKVNHTTQHWLLLVDGVYYDPEFGNTGLKKQYTPTGYVCSADIIPSVPPVQITEASVPSSFTKVFTPFETNLKPSQEYSDEVKRMQSFLTVLGFFKDSGPQDGYYGPKTQAAVHAFQGAHGILNTTQYGWWYPITRGRANEQLTINVFNQTV